MGATITINKKASAFLDPAGVIYYLLFEQTYESNVYPHTPSWGCVSIGTLEQSLDRIFCSAAACEGGSLRSARGHIAPEHYIAAWIKCLRAPVAHFDEAVDLSFQSSWRAPVNAENAVQVCAALLNLGRRDLAEQLMAVKPVPLSLHNDAALLAALTRADVDLAPWRIVRDLPVLDRDDVCKELAYQPARAKGVTPDIRVPAFLKFDSDVRLAQSPDGGFYNVGSAYSAMGDFIRSLAKEELVCPGSYRGAIRAFRAAMDAADDIPAGTTATVRVTQLDASLWYFKATMETVKAIGVQRDDGDYDIAWPVPEEHRYQLGRMAGQQVLWRTQQPLPAQHQLF